ncbi:MAG TPA: hypothetical protein VKV21_15580 [Solirubrobacteraceae bacterium]|nr:hypothetical protein [Solirubrobacteraceae bacterium]
MLVGVLPLAGSLMLLGIFVKAFHDYSRSGVNYSPPIAGVQVPIVIGIGGLILGVILMLVFIPLQRGFFRRRPELPGPDGRAIGSTIAPEDDATAGAGVP